jgi:hypothetical protein
LHSYSFRNYSLPIERGTHMTEQTKVTVYLAMDEQGNAVVSLDRDDLLEQIGTMASENSTIAARVVELTVKMTTVDVPDEAGTVSATAAE